MRLGRSASRKPVIPTLSIYQSPEELATCNCACNGQAGPGDVSIESLCHRPAKPIFDGLVTMTEFGGQFEYTGLLGPKYKAAIASIGNTVLLGAVIVWVAQRNAIAALIAQLKNPDGDVAQFVQLIVNRAPPQVRVPLLVLALDGSGSRGQIRGGPALSDSFSAWIRGSSAWVRPSNGSAACSC
jgi:hypothetical protein